MTIPLVSRIRRDLETAADRIDRESLTPWLTHLGGGTPLALAHPRMGPITIAGVRFSGSVVPVFDRYVTLTIDDLISAVTDRTEEALADLPRPDREPAVQQIVDALDAVWTRLIGRASEIKGVLSGAPGHGGPPRPLRGRIEWTPYEGRLRHALRAIRMKTMTEHKIPLAWFQRYDHLVDRMADAAPGAFAQRARRLADLTREPDFADVRALLLEGVDFAGWLARAQSDEVELGEPFPFPDDPTAEIGVALALLDHIAGSEDAASSIAGNHYAGAHDSEAAGWRRLVDQVYRPQTRELTHYLRSRGWLETPQPSAPAAGNSIVITRSPGVVVQQDVRDAAQTVHVAVSGVDVSETLDTVVELLRPLLEPSARTELDAEAATIRAQLRKPRPNAVILRECGATLRSLVESVAANALTPPALVTAANLLWSALGQR